MYSRWVLRVQQLTIWAPIPRSQDPLRRSLSTCILPSYTFLLFQQSCFLIMTLYSRVELRERRHSVNGSRVSQHRTRETGGTVVLVRDTGEDKFSRPRTHLLSPSSPDPQSPASNSGEQPRSWNSCPELSGITGKTNEVDK